MQALAMAGIGFLVVTSPVTVMLGAARFRGRPSTSLWCVEVLFVAAAVLVLGITLWGARENGSASPAERLDLNPFSHSPVVSAWATQWLGNLALGVPAGVLGAARFPVLRQWQVSALLGTSIFLFIEVAQFVMDAGRVASVQDLLLGSTGWTLGSLACGRFVAWTRQSTGSHRPRHLARLLAGTRQPAVDGRK